MGKEGRLTLRRSWNRAADWLRPALLRAQNPSLSPVRKSIVAQQAVRDCGFVQLDDPACSHDLTL